MAELSSLKVEQNTELNSLNVSGTTELNSLTINGIGVLDLIINSIYPVGSIYISVNDTNPSALFGGTWESWGSGKMPIGVDSSDSSFNTVEKTGGTKTVSLSHTHTLSHTHGIPGVAHTHTTAGHTLTTSEIPSHNHSINGYPAANEAKGHSAYPANAGFLNRLIVTGGQYTSSTGGGGSHSHGDTGSTTPSSTTTNSQSTTTTSSSGSSSQSIMNPYITCYMWKRIS